MREHIEQQRDDFDSWCDKWDKAQEDGVFDDVTDNHFAPSPQTAQTSFFGAVDADPTPAGSDVDKVDAKYWNRVYNMSDHQGMAPDPLEAADGRLLQEDKPPAGYPSGSDVAKVANVIANSPNPIRPNTVGPDQDMGPDSLGVTFNDEDLEEIAEVKLKIHELEDKLNSLEGVGKKAKGVDGKIEGLREKLEDLSTALSHTAPESLASGI